MKFEPNDRVRVVNPVANPFWGWTGTIEEMHVLGCEVYYKIKTDGMLLLFHESWLSKIV